MEEIFSTSDYNKLQVFSYIENSDQERISIKEIEDQFDLTYFKATKLMNSLILDFEDMAFENYFRIEKKSNKYVFKKNGLDSINRLIWMYGRKSQVFNYLDYSIKYSDRTTEDFGFDYFVSLSTAYKIRNESIEYLEKFHANIFSDDYSEQNFRYLISQLYTNIFKFYEYPFDSELFDLVNKIITCFEEKKIIIKLEGFEKLQLVFYLSISLLRIDSSSNSIIAVDSLLIDSNLEERISKILFELSLEIDIKRHDIRMLINYLRISNMLSDDQKNLDNLKSEYQQLLSSAIHNFFSNSILDEYEDILEISLKNILLKYIFFKNIVIDKQFYTQLNILEENYFEVYKFCCESLKKEELIAIFGAQSNNKSFIMEFIFCIINNVTLKKIMSTVTVTVNFSVGLEYNHFIMDMVKNLPLANLQVNDKYSEKTDIYLSDILTDNITSNFVIWNNPPTANDWKLFGNLVSKIKDGKS
jgi:hypothetical protein